MAMPQVLEGTWEEIKGYEAALAGRFLRVIIEPEAAPAIASENGQATPDAAERAARVKRLRGKFAATHTGPLLASEELHRERQADKAKEEQQIAGGTS